LDIFTEILALEIMFRVLLKKINVKKRPAKTKTIIKAIIKSIFIKDLLFFLLISDKNKRKATK